MTHLANLFATLPWWKLEPEAGNTLLTSGKGEDFLSAVAARTKDRSLAVVYLPSVRNITFDLGQLKGPEIKASWFDPSNGLRVEEKGAPFATTGPHRFRPPDRNAAGFSDWVLILQSEPERSRAPTSKLSPPHSSSPG